MKFGLFYELSVPRPWTRESERTVYDNALEQVKLADELGFDQVWAVEHHFLEEYSHCPAPELFLTACAMVTKRIRVGFGIVVCVPEFNHPIKIAERTAVLDILSGGRVEVGNDQVSTVNFLYCGEDDAVGLKTGRQMANHFNYLAAQLISVRETYPSKSYPSLGLLPQLRRQATGPDASEQAGEGLCLGGPERITRALKRWEACGVDRVNFLVNTAESIPQAEVLASLRLFAREVMPAFNGGKS